MWKYICGKAEPFEDVAEMARSDRESMTEEGLTELWRRS